jgi:hypothetical protein
MRGLWLVPTILGMAGAQCPYLSGEMSFVDAADDPADTITVSMQPFTENVYLNDTDSYMTTDSGTSIQDQTSLKAGTRGPTMLEDFMFRQKLQRFDHERVILSGSLFPWRLLIKAFCRFRNELFTREVLEPTELLPPMETGQTLPQLISSVLEENRPQCSAGFRR